MKIRIIKKGKLPKAQFGIGSMYGAFNNVTNKSVNNFPPVSNTGNANIQYIGQPQDANISMGAGANNFAWNSGEQVPQVKLPDFQASSKTPAVKKPFGMGPKTQKTFDKLSNIGDDLQMGVGVASGLIDTFINNPRIDKENRNRARIAGMTDSLMMAAPEDRGDWVASGSRLGELRPDQYTVNKGMYTGQFYPTMAYGGSAIEDDLSLEAPILNTLPMPSRGPKIGSTQSVLPSFLKQTVQDINYKDVSDFVKEREGFAPKAGWDYAQHSVGYGTKAKYPGEVVSKDEAEQRLNQELVPVIDTIKSKLKVPVTSGQLIALASINYNTGSLANRLIDALNNGADPEIIGEQIKNLALTGKGSSKILPGLVKRRQKEAEFFTRGFEQGGEYDNYNQEDIMMKHRIRITGGPDLSKKAYGGQNNYGLDLGQKNVYSDMIDNPYDNVGNTLGPVPREEANIEAERGETIVGDFNDDGRLKHMNIGGKLHSEGSPGNGGTPLNVPEGSFVFSQTKKMAIGGPALKFFGKSENSKSKYTPAQLAKQYDLNKYQAIIDDPNADYLSKNTAKRMLENNTRKLGMLAYIQEGKKGFPNGIPDLAKSIMPQEEEQEESMETAPMAKYGGNLQRFDPGGITPRIFTNKQEFEKERNKGYKQVNDYWEKRTPYEKEKAIPGTKGKSYIPNENAWWKSLTPAQKAAHNAKVKQMTKTNPIYTGTPGKAAVMGENIDRISFIDPPTAPINQNQTFQQQEDVKPYTEQTGSYGRRPFFGTSLFVTPKRESFYAAPMNAVTPEPTFYDPNRQLAANAEQANISQQYLASMGAPQSFMANASAVNAKAFENAANTNAQYQNQNVGVANAFAPMQAEIMNKMNMYNADRADKLYWNQQQGEKEYRNAQRQYLNQMDAYRQNEYDINTKTNMENQTNPYYDLTYGPRGGSIRFKPGVNVRDLIAQGRQTTQQPQGLTKDQYLQAVQELKNKYGDKFSEGQIQKALELQYPNAFGRSSAGRSLADVNAGYGFTAGAGNAYPYNR
jgi:GH24 family phage-related lysozyme (muramidase)